MSQRCVVFYAGVASEVIEGYRAPLTHEEVGPVGEEPGKRMAEIEAFAKSVYELMGMDVAPVVGPVNDAQGASSDHQTEMTGALDYSQESMVRELQRDELSVARNVEKATQRLLY